MFQEAKAESYIPARIFAGGLLLTVLLGAAVVFLPPLVVLGTFASLLFVLLLATKPLAGIALMLFVRSSLDILLQDPISKTGETDVNSPTSIFMLLFLLGGLLYFVINRKKIPSDAVILSYILFLSVLALGIVLNSGHGLAFLVKLFAPLVLYMMIVAEVKSRQEIVRLLFIIVISALAPFAVGFYQAITVTGLKTADSNFVNRILGTFVHPNMYAFYLLMVITVLIVIFIESHAWIKYASGILLGVALASMYLTYTRAGWVGVLLIFGVVCFLKYRRAGVLLAVLGLGSFIFLPSIFGDISARFSYIGSSDITVNSLVSRFDLWQSAFQLFLAKPILGVGIGGLTEDVGTLLFQYWLHNDYLRLLAETGILGLVSFMIVSLLLVVKGWQLYRHSKDTLYRNLGLGFVGLWLAYMAMSFSDNLLTSLVGQVYYWTLFGLIASAMRLSTTERAILAPAKRRWVRPADEDLRLETPTG